MIFGQLYNLNLLFVLFGEGFVPILADDFNGMLRAIRSVAAEHSSGGAIFFTAPTDAFGVFGFERKAHFFLFHRKSIAERWAVVLIDIGFYNAV